MFLTEQVAIGFEAASVCLRFCKKAHRFIVERSAKKLLVRDHI